MKSLLFVSGWNGIVGLFVVLVFRLLVGIWMVGVFGGVCKFDGFWCFFEYDGDVLLVFDFFCCDWDFFLIVGVGIGGEIMGVI